MPTVAYLGLDISQADVSVCFLLADGSEPVPRWTVANSQPGADSLSVRIAQLCQTHQVAELRIGLEATGLLWWHLACALIAAPPLRPFQPHLYVLNPHLVATFRRNYGALPKTDRADAFLIAERVRFGRQLPPPFQVDVRYAPLQRLTRFRFHLAHNLAREKSYFLSFLFLTFSSFGQVQPFGDPFGATASAVLSELTTEELAQQSLADLATYLQAHGHGHFSDPQVLALDPCVTEEFLKLYVAYKAETNFVDVVPQAKRLRLSLNLAFHEIDDPKGLCTDVSNRGRWGNGDVEVGLASLEELPYVMGLVRQALERQMGSNGSA